MWDPGEYREGNIRVSTGKGRIQASTENVGSGRVPEMWDAAQFEELNYSAQATQTNESVQLKQSAHRASAA